MNSKQKHQVAVLGGGSFGTAISNIMADNGHKVSLWLRNAERAKEINQQHTNSDYLPDYPLNPELTATTDLSVIQHCDIVFMSVPSASCRELAKEVAQYIAPGTALISTTKGIEAENFSLMSQVLAQEIPQAKIGVLSGPNLAKEIAAKQITGTVIASENDALNESIQDLLQCGNFRVYASNDVYGVELGGALKNIYAIIAGMAAALGSGQNTISVIVTRSLAEMSRFAVHKGADPMTFLGLAGVGDLIATCMSPLSRNYRVGFYLGEGKQLDEIIAELGQVAEGVNTLKFVKKEAEELDIYMPLVNSLYAVIYEGKTIAEVVDNMMFAEQSRDVEFGKK